MPLNAEEKQALAGNPFPGTPDYNRKTDHQPFVSPKPRRAMNTRQKLAQKYAPSLGESSTIPINDQTRMAPWTSTPQPDGYNEMDRDQRQEARSQSMDLSGQPIDGSMGIGQQFTDPESEMMMGPDPLAQTPMVDDETLNQIERAIVQSVRVNTENAIGRDFWRKQEWMMYRLMRQGIPPGDDPNNPLVQLGFHSPILARYEQQMRTLIINSLFPDEDWFELIADPMWGGLDNLSEALTSMLRRKFRNMTPHATNGFLNCIDLALCDYDDLGTMILLPTYDVIADPFEPGNTDGLIDGPAFQWIDVFNAFPWRADVNSLAETFTDIYDPVTPENIERMGFVNMDKILKESPRPLHNRYIYEQWANQQAGVTWNPERYYTLPAMDQYERWLGLGRFPFAQVRKSLSSVLGDDFAMNMPSDAAFAMLMNILAPKFGFDPSKATADTWFQIERIGETLAACKPYALSLPRGKGPLIHDRLYVNPGFVWGDGVYKRCQLDERFYNDFERAAVTITKWSAMGFFGVRDDMLDDEYRQHRGDQDKWEPGDQPKLKMGSNGEKFIEKLETNEAALPLIKEKQQDILARMQMITSINNDVQGQSNAKTATQSANNLQQALSISDGIAKKLEHGLLKEIVARAYVIMQQSIHTTGYAPPVSLSIDEQMIQQVMLQPWDIANLTFIEIRMLGRNNPGNKLNQAQAFMQGLPIFMPTGVIDIQQAAKMWVKLMDIAGGQNLIFQPAPQELMKFLANLSVMGMPPEQAMMMLPPAYQQQLGMMLAPPPSGAGGGEGPPNSGAAKKPKAPNAGGMNSEGDQPGMPPPQTRSPMMAMGSQNGQGPGMFAGNNR